MRVRHDPPSKARGICLSEPAGRRSPVAHKLASFALLAALLPVAACGGDEDAGGSGDSQTTKPPPDVTTSTTQEPTTSASETAVPTTGDSDSAAQTTDITTGDPSDPLTVDCGAPPKGAEAAKYSHSPQAMGGSPAYTWSAEGLPDGLTIDVGSGLITGVPTLAGDYTFQLSVTDQGGMSAMTTCPQVIIGEQLRVDFEAMPGPCVTEGESILDYIVGGDGSAIDCATPKGVGDGTLPDGLSVDKVACTQQGTIVGARYGTYAWIVRARQSGVEVFAPYCATQDKQAAKAYSIIGNHSGGLDNALEPLLLEVDPDQPLRFDGMADPAFVVDKGVCGASCLFGFAYKVSPSPFGIGACNDDKDTCFGLCPLVADPNEPDGDKQIGCSLVPAMGDKTGFAHELWAKGDPLAGELRTRPFVLQWLIDYCVSGVKGECSGKDAILKNGDNSNLAFAVIVRPQP